MNPETIDKINTYIAKVVDIFEKVEPVPVVVAVNAMAHVMTWYCQTYGITSKDQLIADLSKLWDEVAVKVDASKAAAVSDTHAALDPTPTTES